MPYFLGYVVAGRPSCLQVLRIQHTLAKSCFCGCLPAGGAERRREGCAGGRPGRLAAPLRRHAGARPRAHRRWAAGQLVAVQWPSVLRACSACGCWGWSNSRRIALGLHCEWRRERGVCTRVSAAHTAPLRYLTFTRFLPAQIPSRKRRPCGARTCAAWQPRCAAALKRVRRPPSWRRRWASWHWRAAPRRQVRSKT